MCIFLIIMFTSFVRFCRKKTCKGGERNVCHKYQQCLSQNCDALFEYIKLNLYLSVWIYDTSQYFQKRQFSMYLCEFTTPQTPAFAGRRHATHQQYHKRAQWASHAWWSSRRKRCGRSTLYTQSQWQTLLFTRTIVDKHCFVTHSVFTS